MRACTHVFYALTASCSLLSGCGFITAGGALCSNDSNCPTGFACGSSGTCVATTSETGGDGGNQGNAGSSCNTLYQCEMGCDQSTSCDTNCMSAASPAAQTLFNAAGQCIENCTETTCVADPNTCTSCDTTTGPCGDQIMACMSN